MKSLAETIYLRSPRLLQQILLNIYGYRLERIRHGGNFDLYMNYVMERLKYSDTELKAYCIEKQRLLINRAVAEVPYYRELFRSCGLTADSIRSNKDLLKIPILEKHKIRENPLRFMNEKYRNRKLIKIHTTGTTGTPLTIYCTKDVRKDNFAYFDRFLLQAGINPRGRRATLWGRLVVPAGLKKPPFWRYVHAQKNLLMSSYHLTDEYLPYYIEKLVSFRPEYIDCYPSSIYALANYANENNISLKGVTQGITTSAETLHSWQRDLIESVFEVPIYDQFGAAEMCVFVGQCREGSYHVHSDYGFLEFLRDDGSPADPGEEAQLVCTGYINPVMPLIRYRIGDRGILSGKQCSCGSIFPVIEGLLGRIDDVIITPDGRKVGRLSPVFKGFPVKEVQFVQEVKEKVIVNIVKSNSYVQDTETAVIQELRKRLGDDIEIGLNYVESIERGAGGKLKAVISTIKH